MKVIGQLERAQLENTTIGTLPGPASTGRVIADVTAPTGAIPKFYNGSGWVPLLTGQASSLVQNTPASNAVVINWANGLYQQVVLNSHTTISFTNPQPGQVHTLVVTQRATEAAGTTPWMYCFNIPDQYTRREAYIQEGVAQSSESHVYSWFYVSAIKPAYATIPGGYGNPVTLPATLITGIDIYPGWKQGFANSPFGSVSTVIGGRTSSPFMQTVRMYDGGPKFYWQKTDITTPTAAAAQIVGLKYTPDGHSLFAVSGTTPFIQAWGVDIYGVPNQNAYANPGTLPAGAGQCIDVHPSGSHVVVGHTTTPFMSAYAINIGAFGPKLSNPATLTAAQVNALAFSPTGDYLAVGSQTSPFLQVYPFDPFTGFGTILANPGTLPAGGPGGSLGKGMAWHPAGTFIAMGMSTSPYCVVYPFNRATGAFGTPTTPFFISAPAATINCVAWSPCGNFLAMGNSANLFIYDMSAGAGLPAAGPLSFDSSGPGVQVNDIVWHPSGELITLALNASPFIMTYPAPRKQKNYLKLNY